VREDNRCFLFAWFDLLIQLKIQVFRESFAPVFTATAGQHDRRFGFALTQ
jgi:hypothetical protein